jgi:hypothetical protein
MWHSPTRRAPRLAPLPLPRLDPVDLWRRHRAIALAQLGPVFGVLLLLCAALWAVGEYATYKGELRRAETSRYLAAFREPPVADAWGRLSAVWQTEQDRQRALLAKLAARSGIEFESALRNYQQFVLETVEERRLPPQIATVRQFFDRLAICIRVGNCDQTIAAAQLRPAVRQFRNQHYYYFQSEGAAAEFDQAVALITPDEPWLREAPAAQH